ncbi:hypothetical protein GWC95_00215 [Sediminibacterium roseum]|uniref:Uncharacterized protein n=1 Tax=Sediminibacterium roseum TaxID=1978412 RepID=A0ABW9ZT05_9BACT|nr:hypothetical protein [Sediminibacterium roseum]NCI48323.1 hypothetical protein [Sediminibacterium roseum]
MRKLLYASCLLLVVAVGCKKDIANAPVDKKAELVETILASKSFGTLIEKIGNGGLDVNLRQVKTDILAPEDDPEDPGYIPPPDPYYPPPPPSYNPPGMDDYQVDRAANALAALVMFYNENPALYELPVEDQQGVLDVAINRVASPSYRSEHPSNPGVISFGNLAKRVGKEKSAMVATNALSGNAAGIRSDKLQMDEVTDCLKDVIIGVIVGNWSTIKSLIGVIRGYNLGMDGIINVCKSAIRSTIGASAAGALLTFGLCVAWEAWD